MRRSITGILPYILGKDNGEEGKKEIAQIWNRLGILWPRFLAENHIIRRFTILLIYRLYRSIHSFLDNIVKVTRAYLILSFIIIYLV